MTVCRDASSAIRRVIATLIFLLACASAGVFIPTSQAAETSSYATWSEVAKAVDAQLAQGKQDYRSGNTAGAAADFAAAYNTTYVASNFATVVRSNIDQTTWESHQQQFNELQQLAYSTGNEANIDQQADALSRNLSAAAEQLDADADLANPKVYAEDLAKQIAADRKKLDAAKTANEGKGERTWSDVAVDMGNILDNAYAAYAQGDATTGVNLVNDAYYQHYEKLGFEKNVMNAISGDRVSKVEYQFKEIRQSMNRGVSQQSVKPLVDELKAMLTEDAGKLDGGAAGKINPFAQFVTSSFGQAFIILLREGLEAILVVAAIIAYLIKSGNKAMVRYIYAGGAAGLAASGILAWLFTLLFKGSGPQQEITEGVVALIAMGMLLYTSNWMLSKSSADTWRAYIENKTVTAVSKGSLISLALLSFLAVFREGAETVMFYQAIFSMTSGSPAGIWAGFASACVVLVLIFLAIRYTSVKIPIRPFFLITSALMAILVVVFAGGGMHALIEGDLINGTYLASVPTNDWLGLYPYAETVGAQILALAAVVVLAVIGLLRQRRQTLQTAAEATSSTVHPAEDDHGRP